MKPLDEMQQSESKQAPNSTSRSGISVIFDRAMELREQGQALIDFSTGEPDFDTPEHIKAVAKRAIDRGDTKYTAIDGTLTLKQAVREKFRRDSGLDYSVDEVITAAGGKALIAAAVVTTLNEGDEAVLASPYWPSHLNMIRLARGTPVIVNTGPQSDFKLTCDQLSAAFTQRTRLLILCSPSNPTGAVYSADELAEIAGFLERWPQVRILSDDVYEKIVFDDHKFATLAQAAPRLSQRTLTLGSLSKSYAMTGWRIGFAGGPKTWIDEIRDYLSEMTGNSCSISQAAAVEALTGSQEFLEDWRHKYQHRRDLALSILRRAPGIKAHCPQGAFYIFAECQALLGQSDGNKRFLTGDDIAAYLLDECNVVVVPGSAFGAGDYFRMSFATSEQNIERGCASIVSAFSPIDAK